MLSSPFLGYRYERMYMWYIPSIYFIRQLSYQEIFFLTPWNNSWEAESSITSNVPDSMQVLLKYRIVF